MDDPVKEIKDVVKTLCTADFDTQQATVEKYFVSSAKFSHPFCRTPGGEGRWYIKKIYEWYKILSPQIKVEIDDVSKCSNTLCLYIC